jgi:hypothetical protein
MYTERKILLENFRWTSEATDSGYNKSVFGDAIWLDRNRRHLTLINLSLLSANCAFSAPNRHFAVLKDQTEIRSRANAIEHGVATRKNPVLATTGVECSIGLAHFQI